MHRLNPGDAFPQLTAETVRHGTVSLPDQVRPGRYGVILVYRAHW